MVYLVTETEIKNAVLWNGVRLLPKNKSKLMKVISFVLSVFTGNKRFMTHFWTTVGKTIYYPTEIEQPLFHWKTLGHELVHVKQWKKYNIFFSISYIFLPIPCFLAWFRWKWERDAYLVTIMLTGGKDRISVIDKICDSLWSDYFYTWPKPWMKKWFIRELNPGERGRV